MGMIDKAKGMVQAVKSGAPGDESSNTADAGSTEEVKASEAKASGLAAWPTGMRFAFALAASALIIFLLAQIAGVFMPTFLAFSLALAVRPVSEWLIRHRWPVGLAALVNIVLLFAILFVMLGLIAIAITAMVTELPRYGSKFQALYENAISQLDQRGLDTSAVLDSWKNVDINRIFSYLSGFANQISGAGTTLFFIIMVAIFVVGDIVVVRRRAAELASYAPGFAIALRNFSLRVRTYFLMTTVFGAVVALVDVGILYVFGVPTPWTWGILAFVANYIPAVGFILSMIPPILLALALGGVWPAVGVFIGYMVASMLFLNILQPRIAGNAVGLNATVSFLSLMVWSTVMGPLGAILAVPLTLFFKAIFVDSDPSTAWIDVFFRPSDEPTSLVSSRKSRDRDGDGLDDSTGKPPSIDTRLREEQIQDAAEKERARAQATLEELNQEALEQAAQKAEKDKANKADSSEKTEE
ncbi:AI-2E family transporter [uncultured Mobiluncus sp.]|uniref:AI-2E family transporter n=1 Tax=uncultured Mobiluncus sp. TaxID=293425 RepID=UPI00262348E5|nr:AI-2E family transporter [uncultured Mobiluncus sp.]